MSSLARDHMIALLTVIDSVLCYVHHISFYSSYTKLIPWIFNKLPPQGGCTCFILPWAIWRDNPNTNAHKYLLNGPSCKSNWHCCLSNETLGACVNFSFHCQTWRLYDLKWFDIALFFKCATFLCEKDIKYEKQKVTWHFYCVARDTHWMILAFCNVCTWFLAL